MLTYRIIAFFLFTCLTTFANSSSYLQSADSLIALLDETPNDSAKAFMYRDISFYLIHTFPDSARIYSKEGYKLSSRLKLPSGNIWNANQLGYAFEIQEEFDSAKHHYENALMVAKTHLDTISEAEMLNVLGALHYGMGDYSTAIYYYNSALELFEEINYLSGISRSLNNLGIIYRIRNKYPQAIDIYLRSIAIKKTQNDSMGLANSYRNLGLLYAYTDSAEKSFDFLQEALNIHRKLNNNKDVAECEIGMGVAMFHLGRLDKAEIYFETALPKLSVASSLEQATGKLLLGAIHVRKGKSSIGLQTMTEAYRQILSSGRLYLIQTAEKEMALVSESTGAYKQAAQHWQNYSGISDSLRTIQKDRAIEEMLAKYETREKENTIAIQQLALEKQKAQVKIYFLIGVLLLVLFILSIAYGIQRSTSIKKLTVANKKISDVLKEREALLHEVHHRVNNNLQMQISLLNMQVRELKDNTAQEVTKNNRDRLRSMMVIHNLLYSDSKINEINEINIKSFIRRLVEHIEQFSESKYRNINIALRLDDTDIGIEKAISIGLIINELVTNSLKHAFNNTKQGQIEISLHKKENHTQIVYNDNGDGFDAAKTSENGIGIKLIHTLIRKLKGDFIWKNNGKTSLTITLNTL